MDRTIDHVVFDMGGVLLTWNPQDFAVPYTDNAADAKAIEDALFQAPQWALLDAGAISEDTMLTIAQDRLPERLWEPAAKAFAHFPENQRIIEPVNDLALVLKGLGVGIYLLSNAGLRFEVQGPRLPVYPALDGLVISAFEHLMKPDPAIYRLLCDRYGLDAASCLFVDDSALNCQGAEKAGLMAHCFDGDVDALVARLEEGGIHLPGV